MKTPRLILRTWTTSDVQDGYAIWGDLEVMKYVDAGESQTIELVFHFSKTFWGRGYATESAIGCIEFAFDQLKPKKIIAGCHPENDK